MKVFVPIFKVGVDIQNYNEWKEELDKYREYINENGLSCLIQVDGGINGSTVKTAYNAGANVFVAGSYVFGAEDVNAAVASLFAAAD